MTPVEQIHYDWAECLECELSKERKSVVKGTGSYEPGILFLGEAPGDSEDKYGVPFCGKSGDTLFQGLLLGVTVDPDLIELALSDKRLSNSDFLEIRRVFELDVHFENIVACRPPGNRDPSRSEIEACRPRIDDIIYELDPLLIVTIGKKALSALVGRNMSILKERGNLFWAKIPGRICTEILYPVLPILHPADLNRQPDWGQSDGWGDRTQRDVLKAFQLMDILREKYWGTIIPDRADLNVERDAE